ncbi:MAG: heme ABC transporter ATP-binding protein [Alphaproteobacteria bacterium]|nr:heme ABC transporter ATP-binding protein [Alphaproteobacteria bacterium]
MRAEGVTVVAGGRRILDGVTLTLRPGELLAVVGPNGAGKSTLLRTLAGELRPAKGTVTLDGRPLPAWPPRDLARRRAVLSQSTRVAFAFTALDVVRMGRGPHVQGRERPEDRRIAREALRRVGLEGFEERAVDTLSGGERQRVHLARVLAQIDGDGPTRYLLMDEPTAAQDLRFQHEVLSCARARAAEGLGVLAVLHDLNLAARYADRVALMDRGVLLHCSIPVEVLHPERLSAVYGLPLAVHRHLGHPLILPEPP